GGPGNPYAKLTATMRSTLLNTVTEDDIQRIARKLVDKAIEGDIVAAREVLNRVIGKPAVGVDAPETIPTPRPVAEIVADLLAIIDETRRARGETTATDANIGTPDAT